ncbi:HugZ family protein, partial [Methylopila musalis]
HAANLARDPRASLLFAESGAGDPLAHPRVSVIGRVAAADKEARRARWLARQPESAGYFDFADFRMLRLEPSSAHLVAGFGRIVELPWADLATDVSDAAGLIEAEAGVVAHMNEDHADATRLYATALLGAPDGAWRFEGCDPLGVEIGLDGRALYLPFATPAKTATDVRKELVRLVGVARERG